MQNNIKLKILDSIGKVYETSKGCKLAPSFFNEINTELDFLAEYFHISKNQSFFLALVFSLNYKGDTVDFNDLIEYFNCNPMKILEYNDDFNFLVSSGLFLKSKTAHRMQLAGANDQYTVNEKISEAILENKSMPKLTKQKISNVIELLEKLYDLWEERFNEDISSNFLFYRSNKLILDNSNFPLVKTADRFKLKKKDLFLYLVLIWETLTGRESADLKRIIGGIFDNKTKQVNQMQDFLSGANPLITHDLVEIVEARFLNDAEIKLTDFSHQLLKESGIKVSANSARKENVISSEDIPAKELIFNHKEMEQLLLLKDVLRDTKFIETQKRLADKGLPMGITGLLHGAPGTGKTEIVRQIAREHQRDLMKVEISKSKSMWFGESEKIIKRVFTDYQTYAKQCERTPILFFNEADAIFSKRKDIGSSNVAQTENTIQNIILEELENFNGILIATTNLANSLDMAFERRFLFKIKFHKPDASIRAKIWKSKLPFLSSIDCKILAKNFDFSGGQIENVLRKNEMHEVIHGNKLSLENLMAFCNEETLVNKKVKVGFIK